MTNDLYIIVLWRAQLLRYIRTDVDNGEDEEEEEDEQNNEAGIGQFTEVFQITILFFVYQKT